MRKCRVLLCHPSLGSRDWAVVANSRRYPSCVAERRKRRVEVLRNKVNHVSGWLLGYGLLLFIVCLDPLSVVLTWEDGTNGLTQENLESCAFFAAVSLVGFTLWARPRVELRPGLVLLRNILRDVRIPADAIEAVDTTGDYVKITAAGRQYTAAGLEQSNLMHMRGSDFGDRAATSMQGQTQAHAPASSVTVRWRAPEWPEILLLALWTVYVAAGYAVA